MTVGRKQPRLRRVAVRNLEYLSPRMLRVTVGGPELAGLNVEHPASSVRLLFPPPGTTDLVMPGWQGNEFLLPDGRRPLIRTFTPLRHDPEAVEVDLEIVLHDAGAASAWVRAAVPGSPAAVTDPGRGYVIDRSARAFLLAGDETAIPAISQLLEALPVETPVQVHIEVARPDARLALPDHPQATIRWYDLPRDAPPGSMLLAAVRRADIDPNAHVWVAGEAASMHKIRRHLFDDRELTRDRVSARGYWKHGRQIAASPRRSIDASNRTIPGIEPS